jgi:hypothetical protein
MNDRRVTILLATQCMTLLGIVGSYLEIETAYPNFGDSKYVTGLQPNVRPQRLVLVLRHRIG